MENNFTEEEEAAADSDDYSTGYKILRYLGFLVLIIIGTLVAMTFMGPYFMS